MENKGITKLKDMIEKENLDLKELAYLSSQADFKFHYNNACHIYSALLTARGATYYDREASTLEIIKILEHLAEMWHNLERILKEERTKYGFNKEEK